MDVFTELLEYISEARAIFDSTNRNTRYEALFPVVLNISKCMEYIRNNEKYTEYNLLLETLRAIIL